jgi:hypothetical protein
MRISLLKKHPKRKLNLVRSKAKKAAPTVSKKQKVPTKAKPHVKSTVKDVVAAPPKGVVASG